MSDFSCSIKNSNIKLTYNGSNWSSPLVVNYSPLYQYYVYYPYSDKGLGNSSSSTQTDATTFFNSGIDAFTPATDQSSAQKFNANDIQVSKGNISRTTAEDITFDMQRQVGLAEITLNNASDVFIAEDASLNSTDGVATNVTVNDRFNYYKLGGKYYAVVNSGNKTTKLSSTSSNGWHCNITGVTAGNKQTVNFPSSRIYSLKVGDIYYSDGFVSHSSTHLSGKTPIGIVGYIGKNYWTEYNTGSGHGGHALVMCLRNVGADGTPSNLGIRCQWKTSNSDDGRTKITTSSLVIGSYNQRYGSGLLETNAMNNSSHPAFQYAKNNTTLIAPSSKCTGWFLPTAGQVYALAQQFGWPSSGWELMSEPSNATTVGRKINDALSLAANGSGYTDFFYTNQWFWTSSEWSANGCIDIWSVTEHYSFRFFSDNSTDIHGGSKTHPGGQIRPFLAF